MKQNVLNVSTMKKKMDDFISDVAENWLPIKAALSRFATLFYKSKMRDLNTFVTYKDLAIFMSKRLQYVADPLGGAVDYYTHPKYIQYLAETNYKGNVVSCDCDDYAVFGYAVLHLMGYDPKIYTLLDGGIKWSHVICVFEDENNDFYSLDTNGLNLLGKNIENLEQAVLKFFGEVYYPARYIKAIETPYPFYD